MDPNSVIPAQEQPIIAPALEQPKVSQSGSSIKKVLIVLLGVIVLGGIVGGAYFLGAQKNAPAGMYRVQTVQKKVVPTIEATITPDPTADWQTYVSQKYKFSVKYPTSLQVNEQNTYYYYVEFKQGAGVLPPFVVSVIADTFIANNAAAYNYMSSDWINSLYALQVGEGKTTSSGASFTKLADTTVGGEVAIVVQVNATGYKQHRVYVKKNGNIYMLSNYYQSTDELTNFQNFISSFKFFSEELGQTVIGGGATSFKKYQIIVPNDWKVEHVSTLPQGYNLYISKNGYKINLIQGPVDGGVCTYPDKPSTAAVIHNDYTIFTEFTDKDGNVYRRGSDGSVSSKASMRYAVCGESQGVFASITAYAVIFYDAPNNPDEQILKGMDAILTTLKAQ